MFLIMRRKRGLILFDYPLKRVRMTYISYQPDEQGFRGYSIRRVLRRSRDQHWREKMSNG